MNWYKMADASDDAIDGAYHEMASNVLKQLYAKALSNDLGFTIVKVEQGFTSLGKDSVSGIKILTPFYWFIVSHAYGDMDIKVVTKKMHDNSVVGEDRVKIHYHDEGQTLLDINAVMRGYLYELV